MGGGRGGEVEERTNRKQTKNGQTSSLPYAILSRLGHNPRKGRRMRGDHYLRNSVDAAGGDHTSKVHVTK